MSYRNVCFTINNYTEDEYAAILGNEMWSYVIIGKEVGELGTPHLQGYGELKKRTRYNTVHNSFFGRAHCEERRGTQEQAINYCKKDGRFEESGAKRDQGSRNDLDGVRNLALDLGMRGITRKYNMQQIKVAEKFLTYNEPVRDWQPSVYWLWGATGVGKSKKAREICNDDTYVKNTGNKWWDGYDGHECVILDDFRADWFPFTYLLGLLDRYAFMVECKGGSRQFLAQKIVITCPHKPEDCFNDIGEDIRQLLRRLYVVENIVPNVPEVVEVILDAPQPLDFDLNMLGL